jgi:hypothetical protein
MVVEGALEGEMDDHLAYARHDAAGRDGGNSRNGHRAKTVLTDTGPVEVSVPRDRESSFEPKIVAKRQRRLTGVDDMVISLSAKGLTHGEIAAHLAEVYGADVSRQTISTITDRVMDGMAEWQNRPLDPRAYSLVIVVFSEEKEPGYGCQHVLVLLQRAPVPAAFLTEHPPGLHLGDRMLDGGPDLAQVFVELAPRIVEVLAADALERHDIDPLDSHISEVSDSIRYLSEQQLQAGGLIRVSVMPCTVDRNRPDSGNLAIEISPDLNINSREAHLAREQVGNSIPVPRRAHRAVD